MILDLTTVTVSLPNCLDHRAVRFHQARVNNDNLKELIERI